MESNFSSKLKIDQEKLELYKKRLTYFSIKGLIGATILSIFIKKPKLVFPLSLGFASGYCHDSLVEIFTYSKK